MSAAGVVLLGTPEDARGFRLAGVAGCACVDRQDVERALAAWSAPGTTMPALVLVSASVHALAPDAFEALPLPVVLVLPEIGGSDTGPTGIGHRSDIGRTTGSAV